jgi:SPP1 gp7 family putative phage head morphogenesis protein
VTPPLDPAAAARRPVDEVLTELRIVALAREFDREAYANHLSVAAGRVLRRAFDDIAALLTGGEFDGLTPREQLRTARLGQRIAELMGDAYGEAARVTVRDLVTYAELEARAHVADLRWVAQYAAARAGRPAPTVVSDAALAVLTRQRVESIAALPLVDGRDLGRWWADTATSMTAQTRREMQTGLVLGENPAAIARRIAPAYADRATQPTNVYRRARRDVRTIARTAVTAVNADAQVRTYTQASGVASVRIVAVLDARTTVLCAALDGRVYRTDDPAFVPPPYHPNCRTSLAPIVDWAALGITPPPRAAELTNPEPSNGYEAWLRAQPEAVQRKVLGATRAALFRDGRATLAEFVTQERRTLTVRELAARYGVPPSSLQSICHRCRPPNRPSGVFC